MRRRERARGTSTQRGYGYAWQQKSRQAIADHPWCANCGAVDDLTTDHPTAMAKGGAALPEVVVVLCRRCNGRKGAKGTPSPLRYG